MASYYDLLNLKPNASSAEIQAAYDVLYNQRRQLVTHHDPKVVAKANEDLQALETIRTTLIDPAKRASYDAVLGFGRVEGLADPEATLRTSAAANTPLISMQQQAPATQRVDAWICSKCKHPNAVGMQFCAKCGSQIGQVCPRCGKTVAVVDPYCAHCGAEIDAARRQQMEQRLRDLRVQLQQEHQAMEPLERIIEKRWLMGSFGLEGKLWRSASILTRLGAGCLAMLPAIIGAIVFALISSQDGELMCYGFGIGMVISTLVSGFPIAKVVRVEAQKQLEPYRERVAAIESWIQQIRRGSLK